MVVAILGQDSLLVVAFFGFPTFVRFPPCLVQDQVSVLTIFDFANLAQYRPYTMKRTATAAFSPQLQETLPSVSNYLSLYVTLNPTQLA